MFQAEIELRAVEPCVATLKPECDAPEFSSEKTEAVIPPAPEDLKALMNAARIGDIETIRQTADILQKDKQFTGFAEELRRLLNSFQMGKIRIFLKSYIISREQP